MVRKFARNSHAILIAAVGAAAVAAFAGNASATVFTGPTTLDQLNGTSNSIQIGGLSFFDFQVANDTGDMPNPSAVTVTPETLTINGEVTFGFRLGGGFVDSPSSPGASDFGMSYQVASLSGLPIISDAHLEGNPDVVGTGSATVTETWVPQVGNSYIEIANIVPGETVLAADIEFGQDFSQLSVQKDILLDVPNGSDGVAEISVIDQTFSVVPEPASLSLLALSAAGFLFRRRRA